MTRTLLLILTAAFFSCSTNQSDHKRNEAFQKFLSRQTLLDIPLCFDICNSDFSKIQRLIIDSSDKSLLPTENDLTANVIGLLKDTNKVFAFIIGYPADCLVPDLVIFDKEGNEIQRESLLADRGCGADCGYFCQATVTITKEAKNFISFLAKDSVFSYTCDSLGKQTPGTREHYVVYKSGSVDQAGHITIRTGKTEYNGH